VITITLVPTVIRNKIAASIVTFTGTGTEAAAVEAIVGATSVAEARVKRLK
jgi:hypothetical protein